jgi:adenosine deaminase
MSVDQKALNDRIYAEVLASDLRMPSGFFRSRTEVAWNDIEADVRERAGVHRMDLSATMTEAEYALESAQIKYRESTSDKTSCRGVTLLSRAARKLLQEDGRDMILRGERVEPGREILRWRFVSLALPPGILIAAATRSTSPPPKAVQILHPSIAPDCPVAQHHVHHAAMMSFEELWASLRFRALLRPGDLVASLRSPRAFCPELHRERCLWGRSETKDQRLKYPLQPRHAYERAKHMAEWGDLIRRTFIAGYVLNSHLHHTGELGACGCMEAVRASLRGFIAGTTRPYGETGTPFPWPDRLIRLARRARQDRTPAVFQHSTGLRQSRMRKSIADESGLMARAFEYLSPDRDISPDLAYEKLFMQYLRVKTAVFRLLVHPPGEHGLAKFLEHFEQIKVYAPEADTRFPDPPDEPGLKVRATEHRVAPDAWFKFLRRPDERIEESAWLIHFKRKAHDKALPLFGPEVRQIESEADQILRALAADPLRLRTLRGVDICGVEEEQPLWVSAEALRRLRLRSREISGSRSWLRLQPLRLTLHAGEDFHWLTSGMRAIAEPFHWNLIERGDRIGHGIALTLDPIKWWQRREGEVRSVKRFDRLLDLAFLAEYADDRSPQQEIWLRQSIEATVQAMRLEPRSEAIPGVKMDVIELAKQVWKTLGGCSMQRLMQTRSLGEVEPPHERMLYRYLWSRSTQELAESKFHISVGDARNGLCIEVNRTERDLLVKARKRLIQEVVRWQVCIESNPSSNLVVGSLDALTAQDFLHRRPTKATPGKETLTWTISTDDPITFSTSLADEYAYAWAGMVLRKDKPYDPSYARALLDEAAATSMRMRFTIPRDDRKDTSRGKERSRSEGEGSAR